MGVLGWVGCFGWLGGAFRPKVNILYLSSAWFEANVLVLVLVMLKCPHQCRALARTGKRCGITEVSQTRTSDGKAANLSLRQGLRQCLFHLDLFCVAEAKPEHPIVVYLDFETNGLSPLRDHIVEIGLVSHRCDAKFSTVVRPPTISPEPAIHGIPPEELQQGPSFAEAFSRCVHFLEHLLVTCIADDLDSTDEEEVDFESRFRQAPTLLLCAQNGLKFDFPFMLSECVRNNMPLHCFEKWLYVDSLIVFRAASESSCLKLQCLRALAQHREGIAAHRALDDTIVLRDVTTYYAERLGLSVEHLLGSFAGSLDLQQTLLHLGCVL